ncbi:unnamed protein product, partial [marine sediment metagenome]
GDVSIGLYGVEYKHEALAVYAYFNNDIDGHAINNAKQLREELLR